MIRKQSAIRVLDFLLAISIWLLLIVDGEAAESRSAIQSAIFRGTLRGSAIVDGEFELEVASRGSEQTAWDWSEINSSLTDLTWENGQPAVLGMALNDERKEKRQFVVIPAGLSKLSGAWSHQGQRENSRVVFDMIFPPGLASTLKLEVPSGVEVLSPNGVVHEQESDTTDMKLVVVDFSGARLRLSIQPQPVQPASQSRCSLDTLYVLRRDGVFIQSILALEAPVGTLNELELELPRTADIEGVTSGGVRLDFQRAADQSDIVRIPVDHVESRFSVRVQAFQPIRWNRKKLLPRISPINASVKQHQVTLRAEKPLEIVTVIPQGFLPTGLTVQGETIQRQFKAYTSRPQLFVDAQFPEPELDTKLQVYGEESGRSISLIETLAVQGQSFENVFDIPDGCDVVSVKAGDSDSQVSAWLQSAGKLRVEYREPILKGKRKSIVVTTQSTPSSDNVFYVQFPVVREASQKSTRVFVGTPQNFSATVDADGWNSLTTGEMDSRLLEIAHPRDKLTVLDHNGSSVWTWPFMILEAPDSEDEVPILDRAFNGSGSSVTDVVARCRLSTDLGPTRSSELIHHYTAELSVPIPISDLQIDLSPDARISSVVIDDDAVSVLRTGSRLELPRDAQTISRLELVYWTQRNSTPLRETNHLSVPELSIPVSQCLWTVRAPASQRIAELSMGGTTLEPDSEEYLGTKFFGPLSQVYWLQKRPRLEKASSQQLFLPASSKHAAIEIWDTALLEQFSWVAFVACLMTGVGLRLFHIKWITTLSLLWLLTLSCFMIWLPSALSILVGGMFAGTVISLILPRKLIHARDFMAPIPEMSPVQVTIFLLPFFLVSSAAAQTTSGGTAGLNCLLTSADYQIVSLTPSTEVIADFEVVCLQPDQQSQIVLPLTGITFPQGGACLVDGQETTLIPTLDGSGYVVSLPASSESQRRIQITFAIRPNDRVDDPILWEIGIPPVVDSTLVTPNTADFQFVHRGASVSDGENIRIQLGAMQSLIAKRGEPQTQKVVNSLVSVVQVNPIHVTGRSFIEVGNGESLTLNFPGTFEINKVVGCVDSWNLTTQSDGTLDVFVRLNQSEPRGVEIDFEFPVTLQSGQIEIPVFPTQQDSTRHVIGLVAEPGFRVEPASDTSKVGLETWNGLNLPLRSKPTSIVQMLSTPVGVDIQKIAPVRSSVIAETVTVGRKELQWQADVEIDVQNLPVFEHIFQVDRDLSITNIERIGENNRAEVWKRSGQRVVLLVPNGQVGTAQYRFRGTMPMSAETWRTIPEFAIEESESSSQNLIIKDQSGWNLQVETAAGTNIQSNAFTGQPESRIVGSYPKTNRPFRIRISPPASLTSCEIVTYVRFSPGMAAEVMSTFQFFADDVPLRKVDIEVPHGLENMRVRPSHLRRTTATRTDSDVLTLRWGAGRQSSAVTISGQWNSDDEKRFVPQTKSNAPQAQYLLLPADSPLTLAPASGRICTEDDMPAWAERIVRLAKREGPLECYQIVSDKLHWEKRETHTMHSPVLVESLVWPQSTVGMTGNSNVWFAPGHQFTIELPCREGMRVTRVMDISGNAIPYQVDDGVLTVQLDKQDHAMISVMWTGSFPDGVRTPFLNSEETQQILGIWKDDQLRAKLPPDSEWTIRIARCRAMFAALREARVSISLDSPLMQQVRHLVSALEAEAESTEFDQGDAVTQLVQELLAEWKDLQREIAITADNPVLANVAVTSVEGLLDSHVAFDWWVTEADWSVELGPQRKTLTTPILATCFVTVIWGVLLVQFGGQFRSLADYLARYPGIILIVLGFLWALLLSPTQMGYALMGVGLISELIRWIWPENQIEVESISDTED